MKLTEVDPGALVAREKNKTLSKSVQKYFFQSYVAAIDCRSPYDIYQCTVLVIFMHPS